MGQVTSDLNNTIKEGINIINGPNNSLFSIVRDTQNNVVSAYRHTVNGLVTVYQGTQQNFFSTANNLIQNLSNIGFDAEKSLFRNFRATEKDIVTAFDDFSDNINENYRQTLNKFFDTLQWSISLWFLLVLLVWVLYGKDIISFVDHIIKNGVKVSF